ncbi:unnamed protein product [Diatraea saccharalis]|uniref:Odorant receptor n=1 Tax=Diatraea saccharalis TaxID=40085 RepID=A0A9N9W9C2_9NEOP|nr:unnamed protein product [Diatraea saccharalis]
MTLLMVSGVFFYNALPWYHNYKVGALSNNLAENETIDFSVLYYYPGFKPEDHYWLVSIWNIYLSFICAVNICMVDVFLALMVFQMIGHTKVLINSLENFGIPKSQREVMMGGKMKINVGLFDEEENKIMCNKMIECINHHRLIIKYV